MLGWVWTCRSTGKLLHLILHAQSFSLSSGSITTSSDAIFLSILTKVFRQPPNASTLNNVLQRHAREPTRTPPQPSDFSAIRLSSTRKQRFRLCHNPVVFTAMFTHDAVLFLQPFSNTHQNQCTLQWLKGVDLKPAPVLGTRKTE